MNPLTNPTAHGVDNVLISIFGSSLLLLVGITTVMIWFVVRYRRSRHPEPTSDLSHSLWLETIWTLIPTLIVLVMFWYGWVNYKGLRDVPEGALEVEAAGRMWSWQFKYDNGRTSNKLYVPAGQPIKVKLTSPDVLHSFFMPAFRIKRDVVPGMENYVWFQAPDEGSYDIFCAEYCGTGHADMITTAEVLPQAEFDAWLNEQTGKPASVARGRQLLEEHGCLGCHGFDGGSDIAPPFGVLKGQQREISRDGQEMKVVVDADYLRRAVRAPGADLVEGYPPIMPSYGDEISEEDLDEIIEYLLEGEKEAATQKPDGNALLEESGCLGCHSLDGSGSIAPSFKGIGSRTSEVKRDGKEMKIKVDADYLRRAIREPNYEIVDDYPAIMPPNDQFSDAEVDAIIEELLKK